jgi:pilus assembly protein Flp/PilA
MTGESARVPQGQTRYVVAPWKGSRMRKLAQRFRRDEEGAALVEYGMLIGLIAAVCILTIAALGGTISGYFSYISAELPAV